MSAFDSVIGERRHYSRRKCPTTAIGQSSAWVWAMPDNGGRPLSLTYIVWQSMPLLPPEPERPVLLSTVTVSDGDAPIIVGSIEIDLARRLVRQLNGAAVALTSTEFTLLAALVEAGGKVRSRAELSPIVLRRPWNYSDRSIDQLAFNLRRKLPPGQDERPLVQTIRGVGFWVQKPVARKAETV